MTHDKKDLDKLLQRHLLLFEKDAASALHSSRERIRERLRLRTPLPVNETRPRSTPWFSRQFTPARIAACFGALILVSAVFYRTVMSPNDVYAIVEKTDGSVIQISQGLATAAKVGDKIPVDTLVRTGNGAEARLRLPDGSKIEMQPESELSLKRAEEGLHIQLKQGSVNVTPTEEAMGKLYVQNREQLVPVTGAMFQSAATPIQTPATPKWEAVSIRPCENSGSGAGTRGGGAGGDGRPFQVDAERMLMRCFSVMNLVQSAYLGYATDVLPKNRGMDGYAVHTVSIEGGPAWIETELYTIEAKAEQPLDSDVMRGPMLQSILEDRFKLKLRRETQEVPLLALTVARGGPKMKPHQEGTCAPRGGGPAAPPPPGKVFCKLIGGVVSPTSKLRVLEAEGLTVEQFIQGFMLSVIYQTGKPIIDKTGLTGKFDYRVEFGFTPRDVKVFSQSTGRPESDFETSPQFIDAVQEQLGLKLENTKGPWEHLVIDHVERPSPN